MKIYLIAPKNPESFWTFDRILPSLGKRCVFPNLALPTVAALTPPPHEVVLCDENVEPVDFDTDADIIGITGFVIHKRRMFEIAEAFRRRGKLVVAGGPFATLCPEELRGKVDVLIVGEAEHTWAQFVRDYEVGRWQSEYEQQEKPSLLDYKLPTSLDTPVPQVLAEVEAIHALGVSNIFVVDDNFIGNKKDAKALLAALAEWQEARGYPIEFMTEVSLNVAQDAELLRLLKQAHFVVIFVGIESPRAASLQETKKTQNMREDIVASVHRIQAAGIEVMAGMIVGFDNDDPAIFEEQFQFIQQARIPISMTGLLNAVPKTPLHARLKAAGRLIAESVGDQFVFTNIVPSGMSRLELYEGYRSLLHRLYDFGNYRRRAMALILNRGSLLGPRVLARRDDLAVVLRIFWTCILRASPRRAWLTLSMCLETACRRPRAIREAFTLALMHKHFHEYARDTSRQLEALIDELREAEPSSAA